MYATKIEMKESEGKKDKREHFEEPAHGMLRTSERPWVRWLGRTHLQGGWVGAAGQRTILLLRGGIAVLIS